MEHRRRTWATCTTHLAQRPSTELDERRSASHCAIPVHALLCIDATIVPTHSLITPLFLFQVRWAWIGAVEALLLALLVSFVLTVS